MLRSRSQFFSGVAPDTRPVREIVAEPPPSLQFHGGMADADQAPTIEGRTAHAKHGNAEFAEIECQRRKEAKAAGIDIGSFVVPSPPMQPFATEFPVKRFDNRAAFPSEVFAWLRGMRSSRILSSTVQRELEDENVHLIAGSGEELRVRELTQEGVRVAVGFQHDMPDDQGRTWRTEAVLRRGAIDAEQDVIRFRTQCLAKRPGAFLESPKKPFLIKALLKEGWGGIDGEIEVLDEPLWLEDDDEDVALAELILDGEASRWLPIIYVSATEGDRWLLTKDEIEKLAYDLGGVAHVVVEPNRQFSFRLKASCDGRNVYNGTLGIAMPHRGFIRRFFLGIRFPDVASIVGDIRAAAVGLRGFMPSVGWDWTEMQEHVLRNQRVALRGSLSESAADELFDDYNKQLNDLQEENRWLKEQRHSQAVTEIAAEERDPTTEGVFQGVIKEIYAGEMADRIRLAARTALTVAESNGIDGRSVAVWEGIVERVPRSTGLDELLADLERATKDPKRMANEVTAVLQRHGYHGKSENRHIRLEPDDGYHGLQNITVPKTPGEIRGLKNQRKQIERTLGISKLP
ncbi:hypothetical protein [Sphingomonas sp. PP-CC-3G-468]|uniref:hypothetical protein n=1 Tax=Sphingomonas sp. PP-CC-3G-468 TaxID=2135656 RepID=UPI0014047EA2|nr:hypothetical protein [Sphingomonas sp. PP-CC-3G-468]